MSYKISWLQASAVHDSTTGTVTPCIWVPWLTYRSIELETHDVVHFCRLLDSVLHRWLSLLYCKPFRNALFWNDLWFICFIASSLDSVSQTIHYILFMTQKHWKSSLSNAELRREATVVRVEKRIFLIESMTFWIAMLIDWAPCPAIAKIQALVIFSYLQNIWHVNMFFKKLSTHPNL